MKRSEIKRKTPLRSKRPEPRAVKREALAIRRPSQMKAVPKFLEEDGVFHLPDGREVCCLTIKKGADEYQRRKRVAWEEQKGICPLCRMPLAWKDSTVDHKDPRGMGGGKRDDRQSNIQAVHAVCNSKKGSRRTTPLDDDILLA